MAALLTAPSRHASAKPSNIKHRNDTVEKLLTNEGLQSKNVTGDSNCYFSALSIYLFGHEHKHMALRQVIARQLSTAGCILAGVIVTDDDLQSEVIFIYLTQFKKNGTWVGEDIILATAIFLHSNIRVYT